MSDNLTLEIVTPEKAVVNEQAQIVMAPGSVGEFGILKGHTPFLTTLNTGTVQYKDESGTDQFVFVSGGFAEALPDKVTILAEAAEKKSDIDVRRSQDALERAEKRISEKKEGDDIDLERVHAALARAVHRIKLVQGSD